jgi:conjugative relaxase-like TrwC/TraI family protein
MLRIIQNTHVNGAKSYYSTADYYSEGQELTGRWRGEAARRLGLHGNVKQAEWDALCDNTDPHTGKQLTARLRKDRTIGYDFNFHVPKSVSILYGATRDERILEAFRDSVDSTMRAMEEEMSARVRKGGKDENRRTGNMVFGEFIHFTSRPIENVPDPHLHAHCFVFNLTHDDKEQTWKAGQFRELKRDAPYFEAVFHSRFAHSLHELGLPIARTKKGWELDGLDKGLLRKFSRRRAQIEEVAREMGLEDPAEWAELGAKTRQRKQKDLTLPELQDVWQSRMSAPELDAVATLEDKLGGDADPTDPNASARALKYAIGHVFERKSVVPQRELLATALKHSVGEATVEQVLSQAERTDLIIGERNGRQMATHRDVLNEESRVIDFARKGRGACRAFSKSHESFKRDWLNDAQKSAVRHIVESRDRVILLRGSAGVGKTTLMQEAVEELEEAGTKVFAFAPSADASRGVLRDAGFKDADTVARLLVDEKLERQVAGQLIWVDEASLLPMKTMDQLFTLAEKMDARVLLSGDRRQHGSVERGSALRLLEEEAGLVPAEIKEIKRQSGRYKEAIKALSEGRAAEGFKVLDDLKWIKEIVDEDRYRQMAADYVETVMAGKEALVVSPTHAEGDRITSGIRRTLKEKGKLGDDERTFTVLENANLTEAERGDSVSYSASGDVLVFHQNAKGFTRGDRLSVEGDQQLPLDQAKRFQVFHSATLRLAPGDVVRITHNGWTIGDKYKHRLDNGSMYRISRFDAKGNIVLENGWIIAKDFGHLAQGYVVTSHAAQGKNIKHHVLVGQSSLSFPASSKEQFYVSCSRARERVTIYTDDKEALLEAIDQSDERVSATEFVNGRDDRDLVAVRESREMTAERENLEREGVIYDR